MKLKSTNKLSAIICGLTLLPLTLLAQNAVITTSTTEIGPISYHDVSGTSALTVTGNGVANGVVYNGTDITLTATYTGSYALPSKNLAHGAYVTSRATLTLTGGTVSTSGVIGHGIVLAYSSNATLNNVNIKTTRNGSYGVYAESSGSNTLAMTGGSITTGGQNAYGMRIDNSSGTIRDVNIETKESGAIGVSTINCTLTLTGGTITIDGNLASGIAMYNTTGILSNVNIKTKGEYGYGVSAISSSTLILTGGTITTEGYDNANGIRLGTYSSGTVRDVNIETKGEYSSGVYAEEADTLTLIDSDINSTGNALYFYSSNGTVSLNHNTWTGDIAIEESATLALTGSNGTVLTGDVKSGNPEYDEYQAGSTIGITLSDEGSKLIGNVTHSDISTVTLTLADGAAFIGSGTLTSLTLGDNTILGYTDNGPLVIDGTLAIGDNILIDFSSLTETGLYTVLDWSDASVTGDDITAEKFNIAGTEVEGTFTVNTENKQLTFNATAIPEPSVYILLGIGLGLLLITARRRNVQS
jgi:hypothetical protein